MVRCLSIKGTDFAMSTLLGQVSSWVDSGELIRFFVVDKNDIIQHNHAASRFYEREELRIIGNYFPRGGVYVDIGSNVGNHVVYVCKFLHPSQAILFEPNPPAISILELNIALNGLGPVVDSSHLGVGLADVPGTVRPIIPDGNLGATRLVESDGPDCLQLIKGDQALESRRVDFIKLDVEGMEIRALSGLTRTISRWRPPMFVEVDNANADAFSSWVLANDYAIAESFQRYPQNVNHMVVPVEKHVTFGV